MKKSRIVKCPKCNHASFEYWDEYTGLCTVCGFHMYKGKYYEDIIYHADIMLVREDEMERFEGIKFGGC